MGTVLIVIIVFALSFAFLYNLPKMFKFLVEKFTALVVFVFSFPTRRKIAKERENPENASSVSENQPEDSFAELQNLRNVLENAQVIIEQKDYEIGLLRNELAAVKSASQNNKLAFNETNIITYLRSFENDSRRIEFCHDTIKFLKHITNDLQSGQF